MKERKILHTPALLAFLTLSAYFLADTVDAVIGRALDAAPRFTSSMARGVPALQQSRELSDYVSILERGLFGDGMTPSGGSGPAFSSEYKLIGTIESSFFSGAVLADGARQEFYRLKQKLPDGTIIEKVMQDMVTLRRPDGTTIDIEVVDETKIVAVKNNVSAGVKKLSDGKFLVDQREVLASTENLGKVLTQARALPYVEQGKTVGFRINDIAAGSIYSKIGLQNGDVVQKINSQDITDPAKFFQLYQGLQNERSVSIDLIRGGRRQTLNYEIR